MKLETALLHAGHDPAPGEGVAVPIVQSTAFVLPSPAQAARLFSQEEAGHIYARCGNPTTDVLDRRLAILENGRGAVSFASGKAAVLAAVLSLCRAGDNIVVSDRLYGGTSALTRATLPDLGIEVRSVPLERPDAFAAAADERTRLFYGETISNPVLDVFPIAEVAAIGLERGIPLVIDNTLGVSLCRPLDLGAAVVVLSCSKYVSGTGSALAGAVVEGHFPWERFPGRYPRLFDADPAYHGVVWSGIARGRGESPYGLRLRNVVLRDLGATLSAQVGFLVLLGLETLVTRMERHSANAAQVAARLSGLLPPGSVFYPGLSAHHDAGLVARVLPAGRGGMVSFQLADAVQAQRFIARLALFRHAANNGDARSLAIHPASTTMAQIGPEGREAGGVSDGYVRLSVGLEAITDILSDLDQAMEGCH